jgi:hypothetical protein
LQAKKLARDYFKDAGRKHKMHGYETKAFIIHGIGSNVNTFVSVLLNCAAPV